MSRFAAARFERVVQCFDRLLVDRYVAVNQVEALNSVKVFALFVFLFIKCVMSLAGCLMQTCHTQLCFLLRQTTHQKLSIETILATFRDIEEIAKTQRLKIQAFLSKINTLYFGLQCSLQL